MTLTTVTQHYMRLLQSGIFVATAATQCQYASPVRANKSLSWRHTQVWGKTVTHALDGKILSLQLVTMLEKQDDHMLLHSISTDVEQNP